MAATTDLRERVITIAGEKIERMWSDWQENGGVSPDSRDTLLIVAETALAHCLPGVAFTSEGIEFNADVLWEKQSDNDDPDYERLQTGRGIAEWFIGILEEV